MRAVATLLALGLLASPAGADVAGLLGRRVTDVRIDAAGAPITDRDALTLVETRLGEPLTLAKVRDTIDHFVALSRYADIQVFAEPDGEGVRLRYAVVPIARVVRVRFEGPLGVDASVLRTELDDQFGTSPASSRLPEMTQALVTRYVAHGYPAARVESRTVPDARLGQVEAVIVVTPGAQVRIGRATVEGNAGGPDLLQRLGVQPGRPLDREAFEARVRAAEDALRDDGYYEAVVSATVGDAVAGMVDVKVRGDRGDRVQVLFSGDPLPDDRRRALVPIERLQSVDEEVVEDGSRNIEQYLRLEGFRAASAPAARQRTASGLQITFAIARGPLHVLSALTLAGVAAMPRAELAPLLKLEVGEPFVDARVAAVATAVAEYYRVRGFAGVQVAPRLEFPPAGADGRVPVDVRLEVVEGTRAAVTEVRFEGVTAVPSTPLLESMALTAGTPYYRPQQAIDREAVERRYRNLGYQRATVVARTEASPDGSGVVLTYAVREGPQTTVDHVLVSGTARTSPELVRRELTLTPGSPLGYDAVLESQQRLSALGLFRRVRITEVPHGADDTAHDVLVEVEEAPSTSVSYGGGLEVGRQTRTGADGGATDALTVAPRGFFEVTRRNLWGKNRSLSLLTSVSLRPTDPGADAAPEEKGGYGLNQYRVIGTFREPRAFGTTGDAQFSAFVERGIRSSFNFDRRGVRAEYARRFVNRIVAVGRYSYDYTTLFDTKIAVADQLLIDRLFPQVRLSSMFTSALRDSRNDVLDPERGGVLGTDLELALRSIGSEVGFAKGFAQAFTYKRLPGRRPFVVALGARLGLARGFEQRVPRLDASGQPAVGLDGTPIEDVVTDLPASERFYAGGDSTVRGFALDRLGTSATLNADGFPTGGNAMIVANLELRTPHVKGVGLVGFVDAGNVFLRASDINVADLRASAGLGLRYRSPLGPLRLDVGFKLDRRDFTRGSERRAVYHLSLGQAF
jgi:outer membrane protein insertion porin family